MMKVNQLGRSMIEMIGVLAIVGVLSVGGIAGYSKAMQKHKINQTVNQIVQIAGGIQTLYAHQPTRYANVDNMDVLIKTNIISADMVEGNTSGSASGTQSLADEVDWERLFDSWSEGWREDSKDSYLNGDASQFCWFYSAGKGFGNYQDCLADRESALQNAAEQTNSKKQATYITTPIGAYMNVTAGAKVFALSLSGVSQEVCIDLVSQNWGTETTGFLGLSVGGQSTETGVVSVADAVSDCYSDVNTLSFMFK